MRAVTGPLQTGTYVVEIVDYPGEFVAVDNDVSKFAFTESTSAKWHFERISNDLYRCKYMSLNVSPIILPGMNVGISNEMTHEWIVKETDVKGEYSSAPAQHPTLFVSVAKDQGEMRVNAGSRMSRVHLFYPDN
ncbi:hypothetical protein APHAL10511_002898 [Amanita phalloides]|nr:hypothetical protein APHAL10511_002898 [Amanita phalloides]